LFFQSMEQVRIEIAYTTLNIALIIHLPFLQHAFSFFFSPLFFSPHLSSLMGAEKDLQYTLRERLMTLSDVYNLLNQY
jgi:hypothetical protein